MKKNNLSVFYLVATIIVSVFLMGFFVFSGCEVTPVNIDFERIKHIESSGRPGAWNRTSGARGLYQITRVVLDEYNQRHKQTLTMDDLFRPDICRRIAEWYMNDRIPKMLRHYGRPDTINNRLIAYNAGIRYVVRGGPLPDETKKYIKKYHKYGGGMN